MSLYKVTARDNFGDSFTVILEADREGLAKTKAMASPEADIFKVMEESK